MTVDQGQDRVAVRMTVEDAEEYSQSLAQIGQGWWRQVAWAFRQGIHRTLDMSRREWAVTYHGYMSMPIEERREAVAELTAEGMSQPEIADTLGVGLGTVNRDLHADDESSFQMERSGPEAEPESADHQQVNDVDDESSFQMERSEPEAEPTVVHEATTRKESIDEPDADSDPPAESDLEHPSSVQVNEGDEWYTPRWLFDALGITFDLDVCAPLDRTYSSVPADQHLTIDDDGLGQPWHGTVWCNPPYSKPEPWARRMIHHRDGLLLTHIPMNAGWCVDVWETCDAIRLFQAMEFVRPDGTSQRPGYWLQIAAFGETATAGLARLQPLGAAAYNKRRVASPMWQAVMT